jgi:hypothetical protein
VVTLGERSSLLVKVINLSIYIFFALLFSLHFHSFTMRWVQEVRERVNKIKNTLFCIPNLIAVRSNIGDELEKNYYQTSPKRETESGSQKKSHSVVTHTFFSWMGGDCGKKSPTKAQQRPTTFFPILVLLCVLNYVITLSLSNCCAILSEHAAAILHEWGQM